jgi:class 3 adenylate cyclase/tetratricopeptide (TPR) repeat protein
MTSCQTCGSPLPPDARFCPACGTPTSAPGEGGTRRPVTIVFTDVVGSTALAERLDAESLGGLMTRYYETMREVVERHGGAVEKFIGDAVVATFGAPAVHEDDALRAVRAAHEMHAALGRLNDELERRWSVRLEVRTGVATGEVLAGGGAAVLGSPANLAARLQTEAADGEILLAATTERLVRHEVRVEAAGAMTLKGFDEPVECFRLLGLDGGARRPARTPHVGREHELSLLELAYRRALRDRRVQLVTVLGEPGIGKTRLVEEAITRLEGDPLVLRGRCLPYGDGITFFPVGEAVSAAAAIGDDDDAELAQSKVASLVPADAAPVAAMVSEAIGLGGAGGAPEETLWAIRRYFELLATERPLVLVFDDLQWAEPTFLDLVVQLVERSRGAPELVVAVARPELFEQRPGWGGGTANAVAISLEPLTVQEGAALVRHIVPDGEVEEDLAATLVSTGGGNPLFLQEYVAMLLEVGGLVLAGETWQAPDDPGGATSGVTPPTLTGLLTARLDRLPGDEREALTHASVVGKVFSVPELAATAPERHAGGLDDVVERLVERDLIAPPSGDAAPSSRLEFRHQLLRDAAYGSLPKARRAELHETFATWLERGAPDRAEETAEIAGFHLAQAHDYRVELGRDDDGTRALASRAADRLSGAGTRALERGDPRAATRLLGRAVALEADPGRRAAMRLRLCNALGDAGTLDRYETMLETGLAEARDAGDLRLRTRFEHLRTALTLISDPRSTGPDAVSSQLRAQADTLRSLGDIEGVAECEYQLATIAWIVGDADAFERSARQALEDATASGNGRLVGRAVNYVINALLRGPAPLADALAELRAIRDRTPLARAAAASVRLGEAEMLARVGRSEEATALADTAAAELDDLGLHVDVAAAESIRAIVADAAGDLAGAERALRRSGEMFRAADDAANGALVEIDLANVLARLGRTVEALELASSVSELAAGYDAEAQVGWRIASARALASSGDAPAAEQLAAEALERAEATGFVVLRADAHVAMADVLTASHRTADALEHLRTAEATFRAKGQTNDADACARRVQRVEDGVAG